jgi:transglutaminase-like putative cysteine protease
MHLELTHTTRYRYSQPAWDSFNELWLRPADDYRQTLLAFELDIEPKVTVRTQRDRFENLIHHFHLPHDHLELVITARSRVVTYETPPPLAVSARTLPELRHRFFEFLAPTARVPLNENWHRVFGALPLDPEGDLVSYLSAMNSYLHGRFIYAPDATDVNTPLADFAQHAAGVCQDFAHAMLALCRSSSIPARYVSGYIHSNPHGDERLIGAEASHAWVEAFLPGSGWVGFDPTNGFTVTPAHVKIGYGRDYDDLPPVRGLQRGRGGSSLSVTVRVRKSAGAVADREA